MRNLFRFEAGLSVALLGLFAASVVALFVTMCSVPAAASDVCGERQTIAAAADLFSGDEDVWAIGPVPDTDAVAAFVEGTGGTAERAAEIAEVSEVMVIAVKAEYPPGLVTLGLFDGDGCFVAAASPVPVTVLAEFFDPSDLPVPEPPGQGV